VNHQAIADVILALHFAFVAFVVGGLLLIWAGAAFGWDWVRNFRFRIAHLAAIGFVALEALIGMACPLTEWEYLLRGEPAAGPTFLQRLIAPLLFYDLPGWVFTLMHVGFAVLVALTFWLLPPRPRRRGKGAAER
jgi:heme A synthase